MQVTSATSASNLATGVGTQPAAISSDFNTFLKMLTTQMQNQDPLNPIESSDYAVQLATFSGVEQQTKTNQLLESLSSQMGVMGMAQMAGWVGMEARAAAPAWFGGSPVTVSPNPMTSADRAVLVVRDATGAEVSRHDIALSTEPIEWAGVDANGDPLASGTYSFELENYQQGTLLGTDPVEVYDRIREVRGGAGGTVLVLEGGAEISSGDVTALRDPG